MPLEIAGVVMEQLVSIETSEAARFVRHGVPGMSGDLSQELGRQSVRIRVRGLFYGSDAADKLKRLRDHLLARTAVDFVCEITGQGYFTQVLVEELQVKQRAGSACWIANSDSSSSDEFDYECVVSEYVPPPPPPAASAFADLDLGIMDEASSMIDDAQNALAQVAGLTSLLSGASDFANPTTRLPAMLESFATAADGATTTLSAIGSLL